MARLTSRVGRLRVGARNRGAELGRRLRRACGTASRSTASRTRCRRRRTVPAVFFVGRHEPRKGLAVLLDAWRDLDRDAVLWVASTGPQTKELRKRNVARRRVAGQHLRPGARAAHARRVGVLRAVAARRVVRRGAARGDGGRHADRRLRDRGVRERRPARAGGGARASPGDVDELRDALRRVLDDAALRERLVEPRPGPRRRVLDGAARASATSSSTRKRSSRRHRRVTAELAALALDTADAGSCRSRAVARRTRRPRTASVSRPAATSTMAIDEIAEARRGPLPRRRRRHRATTRRTAATSRSADPRAIFVIDPIDGTRPAAAGLESCCVSIAVVPPQRRRHARRRLVRRRARDQERRPSSTRARGRGAHARRPDGSAIPLRCSDNVDLARAVLDRRVCGAGRCCRCRSCSST